MALYVYLYKPFSLVQEINKLIDQGIISSWEYDNDMDYTHKPIQWRNEAWIRFCNCDDESFTITFGIIPRKTIKLTKTIYAVYHGRFAEMLLRHFDTHIKEIRISSMLVKGVDIC